jgi:hypothetical protein
VVARLCSGIANTARNAYNTVSQKATELKDSAGLIKDFVRQNPFIFSNDLKVAGMAGIGVAMAVGIAAKGEVAVTAAGLGLGAMAMGTAGMARLGLRAVGAVGVRAAAGLGLGAAVGAALARELYGVARGAVIFGVAVPIFAGFLSGISATLGIALMKTVLNNRNAIFNPQPQPVALLLAEPQLPPAAMGA